MTDEKRNLPASVAARLLSRAKQTGQDYQITLMNFCFERFLAASGARGRGSPEGRGDEQVTPNL